MLKWILTAFFIFSFNSWAGDKVKNGGDIVICPSAKGKTYEVLDLVEARMPDPVTYHIIEDSNENDGVILQRIFERLSKWNPTRARLYQSWAKTFLQEARIIPNANFTDLIDEGGKIFPADCEAKQAVLQYRQPDMSGVRYLINGDLWNQISNFHKAALIFHELIYRELSETNFRVYDSSGVRLFNAFLFSKEFDSSHLQDYIKVLQFIGLSKVDYRGYEIALNSGNRFADRVEKYPLIYFDQDHILSAALGSTYTVRNQLKTEVQCLDKNQNLVGYFSIEGSQVRLTSGCMMLVKFRPGYIGAEGFADWVNLLSPFEMESLQLINHQLVTAPYSVFYQDMSYHLVKSGESHVSFWKSGQVKMIKKWSAEKDLMESFLVTGANKNTLKDLKLDRICFSEMDQIEKCQDSSEDWF